MEPAILAHQGGWDEALMVLVPIGVFVLLLRLANRRARAIAAQRNASRTIESTPMGEHDSQSSDTGTDR